jgi:hypothetical protein
MKKVFAIMLVFAVAATFASGKVKSKLGDIQLTDAAGGGKVVCQAGFNDEMTVVKKQDIHSLVKASCGQGWVNNAKIETVLAGAGSKSMNLDAVDVTSWIDNPSSIFVLGMDQAGSEGINITRNFSDFLVNTLDREQTEMRNQEN